MSILRLIITRERGVAQKRTGALLESLEAVKMSRKSFLRLSLGGVAAASAGGSAFAREPARDTSSGVSAASGASRILIRNADLLTMDPQHKEMAGGDVLIDKGRIAAIGRNLSAGDAEVIDASGKILMPGMIDGHRHLWQCVDAGRLVKMDPTGYSRAYLGWQRRTMACMTAEDNYLLS